MVDIYKIIENRIKDNCHINKARVGKTALQYYIYYTL